MEDRRHDFSLSYLVKHKKPSLFSAGVLLVAAYALEHYANIYAFAYYLRPTSAPVGDIVLDNIPPMDLNFLIIEGALIAIAASIAFVLSRPRHFLFTVKALALFVSIRAVFISLTHIGIYPDHIVPGLGLFAQAYQYFNFQTGLFFSGHTGLPVLMALIFWQERWVRTVYLLLAGVFATAVLLAHVHYSIDVLAAPFMAYSIFALAKNLFKGDYDLIESLPRIKERSS